MSFFNIKKTLKRSKQNNPDDVLKIKDILNKTGHYKIPDFGMTPYADENLFTSIKNFQKENDLKVDGIITPDGETIEKLAAAPIYRCSKCQGPHGGVFSPDICHYCYNK